MFSGLQAVPPFHPPPFILRDSGGLRRKDRKMLRDPCKASFSKGSATIGHGPFVHLSSSIEQDRFGGSASARCRQDSVKRMAHRRHWSLPPSILFNEWLRILLHSNNRWYYCAARWKRNFPLFLLAINISLKTEACKAMRRLLWRAGKHKCSHAPLRFLIRAKCRKPSEGVNRAWRVPDQQRQNCRAWSKDCGGESGLQAPKPRCGVWRHYSQSPICAWRMVIELVARSGYRVSASGIREARQPARIRSRSFWVAVHIAGALARRGI